MIKIAGYCKVISFLCSYRSEKDNILQLWSNRLQSGVHFFDSHQYLQYLFTSIYFSTALLASGKLPPWRKKRKRKHPQRLWSIQGSYKTFLCRIESGQSLEGTWLDIPVLPVRTLLSEIKWRCTHDMKLCAINRQNTVLWEMTYNNKSPERTAVSLYWVLPQLKCVWNHACIDRQFKDVCSQVLTFSKIRLKLKQMSLKQPN